MIPEIHNLNIMKIIIIEKIIDTEVGLEIIIEIPNKVAASIREIKKKTVAMGIGIITVINITGLTTSQGQDL